LSENVRQKMLNLAQKISILGNSRCKIEILSIPGQFAVPVEELQFPVSIA